MQAGPPDIDEAPAGAPSLAARTGTALKGVGGGVGWRTALLLGGLIAAGPLATVLGAHWLTARVEADNARMQAVLEPRLAAEQRLGDARRLLAEAVARPPLTATLEALARSLPADAALLRAERTRGGLLELEISAADPDRLRAALRRAPEFERMRNTSQRQADGGMIVALREPGE